MWSLQSRAIAGGLIWAVSVVFAGTFALVSVFDQMVNDLFNAALKDRHMQVVAALGNAGTPLEVQEHLSDPAYTRPYSGRYWQINGPETVETSRSLFDTVLALPKNRGNGTELWMVQGPMGPVRGISETITLDDRTSWEVSVAETVENLTIERAELRKDLAVYFGLVGLFMVLGAVALTSIILRPIRKLRREVFVRWEKGAALDIRAYPAEVAPLVEDIETLLERNREIVDRGRRQAADLAHALKTPSAALRNELAVVAKRHDVADAQQALDRIDAQICRSLARMRAQNAAQVTRD
ncbi:MAG: sensor histidine kinase, partial [Pseudomonadota bacterium]